MLKILSIFLIGFISLTAQKKDPDLILKNVKEKFNKVQDYIVDVNIKVDVDFLKVPETQAKIYYKQSNKVHVESESFALLPKEGLDFSPLGLLKDEYTAIYEREEEIDGIITSVIKVIPLGESADIILSTLWVDEANDVIRKIESTTKLNGTFSIEFKYNSIGEYALPSALIFSFNVDKMNIPKGMSGDFNQEVKRDEKKGPTTGRVFINYSNYKINTGLTDKFFEDKKKK
jgi:hypothetical protein